MEDQTFDQLLQAAVNSGAADVHLKVGSPCMIRDGDDLSPVTDILLRVEDLEWVVRRILKPTSQKPGSTLDLNRLDTITDLDVSYSIPGLGRFRVNISRQRGTLAVTMRVIASEVPDADKLQLPETVKEMAHEPRGLILVTGATGNGKSTTLAAMIDHVNKTVRRKVVTIEDPIEFLIPDILCSVNQREVGSDSAGFTSALRAALRQDTDIIMVGEMRDRETIEIALKAAETGHLVLSSAHTSDAEGTITRLLGVFDPAEQAVVRLRLLETLRGVISQRLVRLKDSEGRIAAVEIMKMTDAIRERIQTSDPRGFYDLIEQGWNPYRMQTFDQHLTELFKRGLISFETAIAASSSPVNFKRNLQFDS